jgi:hypothetical protein
MFGRTCDQFSPRTARILGKVWVVTPAPRSPSFPISASPADIGAYHQTAVRSPLR